MIAEAAVPTLLEDWLHRRAQLEAEIHESNDQTAALAKVLDFLIRRYEGTETALQSARAPSSRTTVLNTRAMIVHHHAWSDVVAGVKSRGQAQERVASVLHRMEESSHRRAERVPRLGDPPEPEDDMGEVQGVTMPRALDRETALRYAFSFRVGEIWAIRHCLAASPYLPRYAVIFLAIRASLAFVRGEEAVALLARCGSPYVYGLAARALAKRFEEAGCDDTVEALAALLRDPCMQRLYYPESLKTSQSRLRERLASEDPAERLRTVRVLALIGDLHDISLLTDLATFCQGDETLAEEHAALVAAVDAISRRSVG
jgi:hypothetical protein